MDIVTFCDRTHEKDARLSGHIDKLQSIPSFNLPAIKSCPYRTTACEEYCYANKGRFKFKDVKAMYQANYEASKCFCFVDVMCFCFVDVMCEAIPFTVRAFRIHSSGDFYSNTYFQKWVEIAIRKPNTIFLAYTRNYTLYLDDLPDNLVIYYSVDQTTKKFNPTTTRKAEVVTYNKTVPHMTKYLDGILCTSDDCSKCGYCWLTKENVYFPQKYKSYSVGELEVMIND
jgi:hypothetical protein